jgi:hypothetical protein
MGLGPGIGEKPFSDLRYGSARLYYTTRRVPSYFPHGFRSVEGLLWGAEPRFELGPALQQGEALQFKPRRALSLSLAARLHKRLSRDGGTVSLKTRTNLFSSS